jgi:hypothetical protein
MQGWRSIREKQGDREKTRKWVCLVPVNLGYMAGIRRSRFHTCIHKTFLLLFFRSIFCFLLYICYYSDKQQRYYYCFVRMTIYLSCSISHQSSKREVEQATTVTAGKRYAVNLRRDFCFSLYTIHCMSAESTVLVYIYFSNLMSRYKG